MLADVFKVVEETPEQVIVEIVLDDDPLSIARHPYINAKWKYITVSKGERRIYTLVKKDGSNWSFSASTIVSENLERLQRKLQTFLYESGISLR